MWAIAVIAILAVIVLLLCVPLDILLRVDVNGKPRFRMRLAWLFGLVSKELGREKKEPEEEKEAVERKPKPRDRRADARVMLEVLRTKGLFTQLGRLLRGLLSRVKIRELTADLTVGLDNPADTALLFGFVAPAKLLLSYASPNKIRLEPSFADEAVLEGYLSGAARVQPVQLVPPLIGFACSLPTMRAVKILVLTRWKGKK